MAEDEELCLSAEVGARDGGRQAQKEMIWEAMEEFMAGSPAMKALMSGASSSSSRGDAGPSKGPSKKAPGIGEYEGRIIGRGEWDNHISQGLQLRVTGWPG